MSRIISPHGPTTILITFHESTGATSCAIVDGAGRTKELPVYQVVAIFAQLITQFLADAARKGAFGPTEIPAETPVETRAETPAGNGKVG
jgi:hypothetical protein